MSYILQVLKLKSHPFTITYPKPLWFNITFCIIAAYYWFAMKSVQLIISFFPLIFLESQGWHIFLSPYLFH